MIVNLAQDLYHGLDGLIYYSIQSIYISNSMLDWQITSSLVRYGHDIEP
jgi:hypothetical protein